jgi:hypothetical protein
VESLKKLYAFMLGKPLNLDDIVDQSFLPR